MIPRTMPGRSVANPSALGALSQRQGVSTVTAMPLWT